MADSKETKLAERASTIQENIDHGINVVDRVIRIDGEIDAAMVARVDTGMSEMERLNRQAITFRISSFGGNMYDALAVVGRMRASTCQIVTQGFGYVMSAATLVLASGDKRYLSEFSWTMCHESNYEVEGGHSKIKEFTRQIDREEDCWAEHMAAFTEYKNKSFWLKLGRDKDHYLNANEAIRIGIADELL